MCAVIINALEPSPFTPKSQYFVPYLIKFHDFADNSQEVMKHQMRGATQAQQGMTLRITLMCIETSEICLKSRNEGQATHS
jgi:hypothetical protein